MSDRVSWRLGDLFGPLAGERYDLIVSNPPYIPTADIDALQPEVACHDPRAALDGGPDGLDVIRRIAVGATEHLVPGGLLALEFGAGQQGAVRELFARDGYSNVTIRQDYAGIPRVLLAKAAGN
jgi:release factor glutamine methyltransferase